MPNRTKIYMLKLELKEAEERLAGVTRLLSRAEEAVEIETRMRDRIKQELQEAESGP